MLHCPLNVEVRAYAFETVSVGVVTQSKPETGLGLGDDDTLDRSRPYLWPNLQTVMVEDGRGREGAAIEGYSRADRRRLDECSLRRGNDQVDAIANH